MVKKNEFIDMIQESLAEDYTFTKKEIAAVVEAVSENILKIVHEEESIKLGSVGTFSGVTRPAAVRRNPRTGENVNVPEKKGYPVFKFSATAKRTEG